MRNILFNNRSIISGILIFVFLLQIGGCSSTYVITYSGNNLLIVDKEPEVDSISVIYSKDRKINIEEYYWYKDKINFIDNVNSDKKQSLKIYDIDSVTFSDQRTMVLVANNMLEIDSLSLKNGQTIEPLDFEWIGEQLVFRTLATYPFKTITTLQDIASISAVYLNPDRITRPGVILITLLVTLPLFFYFYLLPKAFAGMS